MRLTRQGWLAAGAAVACLVAGRLLGPVELWLIGAALGVLLLGAVVYVRVQRLDIAVERELHPPRVHAGTPSRVDLRVRNNGRRRTPVLSLRDAVSGTRGAHLLLGPQAPGGSVSAAYRLPTEHRGIVEIGPLEVSLGDPFGLTRITLPASGVSELTVYPRVDEIVPVPQTTGNDPMAGAEHPNALGRSGEDFYGLRTYVVGDDLRKVHWASTARHDELMVRQDEQPWQGRATLLVDVRASTNSPASLELLVSAAASVVMASARRQDLIRLVTSDGVDSGFAAGHAHREALMEHLASVQATYEDTFEAVVDRLARSSPGGALIVVVADLAPATRDRLLRLRQRFGSVTVVQFEPPAWDPLVAPEEAGASHDGVLRIRGGASFADAWNASMRTARSGRRGLPGGRVPPPEPDADAGEDRWARHARIRP